jgi:hypothetical protein
MLRGELSPQSGENFQQMTDETLQETPGGASDESG